MAIDTGDKVTRKYANFRGVDFRGEECSLNRSPDALNVWRNYKKLASIETRPGLENLLIAEGDISHIKKYGDMLYYIRGGSVYAKNLKSQWEGHYYDLGSNGSLFEFEGQLYAKGTYRYVKLPKNETEHTKPIIEFTKSNAFIPTTTIKKPPSGGGEKYQDVNMLSPYRINTFRGDGKSNVLHLDTQYIDTTFVPIITIGGTIENGGETEVLYRYTSNVVGTPDLVGKLGYENGEPHYMTVGMTITGDILNNNPYVTRIKIDSKNGTVTIEWDEDYAENPFLSEPWTDGQDNIAVVFMTSHHTDHLKIMECTIAQEFDNRLFLSGNPDYPNTVWHSSLSDPTYFSDLDYYEDGKDSAPIRSLVAGNNALWVFRDAETSSGVFYHVPTLDVEYGKVYPSSHSSVSIGCVGRAINFNDDIVFFSRIGMESVSTDVTTEQFATHKSSLVDRKMITNPKYKDMVLAEWEGYLFVFIGNEAFLADSRAVLTNEGHAEYEWYYWKLFDDDVTVTCATTEDGVLYIGTNKYVYSLTVKPEGEEEDGDEYYGHSSDGWGEKNAIESYWTTPKDKFGAANKLKTTNKKGCVVEATGDVDVYAKVEDTDFELIGENNGVEDYFVSRIKRKKFKDIQLKFQSQTRFCLESATLECFVGGYIKR